jgi:hypothetical protein
MNQTQKQWARVLGLILLGGASLSVTAALAGGKGKNDPVNATARFPVTEGKNLEGTKFTLPSGFAGKRNLVFVAFQRQQQDDVDTWVPLAKEMALQDSDLRFYEVPTLSKMNGMIRSFIDGGMKSGIPDKSTREITITVYIDKTPFRKALAIPDEKQIHALIVTQDGSILWRSSGKLNREKEEDLRRFIRSTLIEERMANKAK